MTIQNIEYLGSFPSEHLCPKGRVPEYAFIGRSNVGKSSLINMLVGKHEVAYTSKKPGKTQSINLFLVNTLWRIVDLPGYGYAKVSKSARARWQKMIERYLQNRQQLVCTFVLIDLRLPLQNNDLEFINWMGSKSLPFVIVFTKADKLTKSKVKEQYDLITGQLAEHWDPLPQMFLTSAQTGEGREAILGFIEEQNALLGIQ